MDVSWKWLKYHPEVWWNNSAVEKDHEHFVVELPTGCKGPVPYYCTGTFREFPDFRFDFRYLTSTTVISIYLALIGSLLIKDISAKDAHFRGNPTFRRPSRDPAPRDFIVLCVDHLLE